MTVFFRTRYASLCTPLTWHRKLFYLLSHSTDSTSNRVQVKLFLWAPRHKGVLWSRVIAPYTLNLGTRWRWVVSFTHWLLYPQRKSPWYPLDRRLGEPQSRSGRGGVEKSSQPLTGLEPPIMQPVVQRYTSELPRLLIVCRGRGNRPGAHFCVCFRLHSIHMH
jgi:hypothetical protein